MVARVRRNANVTWRGELRGGSGTVALASNATPALPLSLETRKADAASATSPEEMLAAAHAACFAMSLRASLDAEGMGARLPADAQVRVEATCVLAIDGTSWRLEEMILKAGVDGLGQDDVEKAIAAADRRCPVSAALRGNVRITLRAEERA